MKKTLFIFAAASALLATSCGSIGGGKVETQEDSVAYALGVDVGNSLFNNVDSTLNYELVCKGLIDAFTKNATMEEKDVQAFLQNYFMVIKPAKAAAENEKLSSAFLANAAKEEGAQVTESGLIYKIEDAGAEHKIADGDTVELHYTLIDASGKVLQSSKDNGRAMKYTCTPTAMIPGFTEGVAMLGEGGKATLHLPYDIAYGEKGGGNIGPKQALKFEVEIVRVAEPAK